MRLVIAKQTDGVARYYDHKLTPIEKGELLSGFPTIQNAGTDNAPLLNRCKDKRLISILQINEPQSAEKSALQVANGANTASATNSAAASTDGSTLGALRKRKIDPTKSDLVTADIKNLEVSVSSHQINRNAVIRKVKNDRAIYTRMELLPDGSELRLAEHQNDVSDLLPAQESNSTAKVIQNFDNPKSTNEKSADTPTLRKRKIDPTKSDLVTAALVANCHKSFAVKQSAIRKVSADLQGIEQAVSLQRNYDQYTVSQVLDLASLLLRNGINCCFDAFLQQDFPKRFPTFAEPFPFPIGHHIAGLANQSHRGKYRALYIDATTECLKVKRP